jgi:Ca-activated chloride channel family protein
MIARVLIATMAAALVVPGHSIEGQERFRAGVDVVRVDVLVMDGGRPVSGLQAEDFELRDRGVVQTIQSSVIADIPVSMLLALDTSESVEGPRLQRLRAASVAALEALGPGDRGALLTFAGPVRLRGDWGPVSSALRTAIEAVQAGGSTSLFDAAFTALTLRDTVPGNRSLIVLFSDGADTSSWLPSHAVLDKARRTDSVVYSAVVGPPARETTMQYRSGIQLRDVRDLPPFESKPFVEALADLTGGSTFTARGADGLRDTFTTIVAEFRSRYLLTYTPEGVDGAGWHPIEVKLKQRKGRVTARRGYDR